MKLDWDMLRLILSEAERCPGGIPLVIKIKNISLTFIYHELQVDEEKFNDFYGHALLLRDAGFAEVRELRKFPKGPSGITIDRLTLAGHEFLATSRSDIRWSQAKEVAKKVGGFTVSQMGELLTAYLKAEVKKHTGLDF